MDSDPRVSAESEGDSSRIELPKTVRSERPYRARFIEIVAVQLLFWLFFESLLDGGVLVKIYTIPLVAYWVSVGVLTLRVRGRYSRGDLLYINRGWVFIIPLGMVAAMIARGLYELAGLP